MTRDQDEDWITPNRVPDRPIGMWLADPFSDITVRRCCSEGDISQCAPYFLLERGSLRRESEWGCPGGSPEVG